MFAGKDAWKQMKCFVAEMVRLTVAMGKSGAAADCYYKQGLLKQSRCFVGQLWSCGNLFQV
ncbi:hypothetical protein [Methylotuvimicrobium sp.]|jgi:hypothetical protein|uniref:hypothetical protein n=1 Tax=Methylotuvimicrobium sp. TaxID=2822413 RepID=UPI003D64C88E